MVPCPKLYCKQFMELDPDHESGTRTALQHLRCPGCAHRGMRALGGLQLRSAAEHDFLVSYGPTPSFITVKLSSAAVDLFRAHGVAPDQLAIYAAEWALIMGQRSGRVNLGGDNLALSACYEYFRRQAFKDARLS
jgi:hypothetical protein